MGEFSRKQDRAGFKEPEELVEDATENVDVPPEAEHIPVEMRGKLLPKPTGYKLLIMLPEPEETTDGGIVKAKETIQREEVASIVGFVADMGPDAYSGERFPSGAWCKKGDWIMMKAYAGTRFTIFGREMRLINDDSVDAVVDDPRGIMKV